jgi:hypothetical protein
VIWFLVFTSLGLALSVKFFCLRLSLRTHWRDLLLTGGALVVFAWLAPWLDGLEVRFLLR